MSAVRLMRLDGDDWSETAVEKIDSPDIEDRLKAMLSVIEPGAPVQLFLPRDQILYTDVELSKDEDAKPQIERALDGRTPYALDELSFDWEVNADGKARVAAIALDTLDEAAAFAEVRDLAVAGYSSLATDEDFPRHPRFDGPMPAAAEPEEAPSFTSARKPSRPPGSEVETAAAAIKSRITPVASDAEPAAAETKAAEPKKPAPEPKAPEPASEPVVKVEDPTPVMKVKPPSVPLDPGIPIAAPNAPPRVRTDIAAASVSGPVASLTPPKSIRVRTPSSHTGTAIVFAVALLLMIGVAVLVWTLLPMRPGTPVVMPPAAESTGAARTEQEESQVVTAPPPRPDDLVPEQEAAVAPEPEAAPVPEPGPTLLTEITVPDAPDAGVPPEIAALSPVAVSGASPTRLVPALRDGTGRPEYDPTVPDAATPEALAGIQTASPFPGPLPDIVSEIDDIYFASIEPADLAFDAIALPSARSLTADPAPRVDPETGDIAPPQINPDSVAAALNDALAGPGGLIPTELAAALPETAPRGRPGGFVAEIERQQFGGRTRDELAEINPRPRPASAQAQALAAAEPAPASELAVDTSLVPRERPGDFSATVADARAQLEAERLTASAGYQAPDTSSAIEAALESDVEPEARPDPPPRLSIPSNASVARQATLEDAIRLNRVNLVGVYGTPSDRRALVRLPSGRYIKVKVGDRVDGGTVARITDSSLQYRKGNRILSLEIPQG